MIQAATNKSEAFNRLVQWLAFGGEPIIATNDRAAQRKIIKYNHLVANCTIFYNLVVMSRVLQALQAEGHTIDPDAVAALSPYITEHIDRFGRYSLDKNQQPPPLDESIFSTAWVPSKDQGTLVAESTLHAGHETAVGPRQLSLDGW
jgi:hypothetical protein